MSKVQFETYGAYPPVDDGYQVPEEDWAELTHYLNDLRDSVNSVRRSQQIEEDPPTVRKRDERFTPHGWVGSYPGGVEVVPDKVDSETYQSLLDESRGFVESVGLQTAEAVLPFSPDVLEDATALYLRYSESCINATEALLSSRLPVNLEWETQVGNDLRGTPNFEKTVGKRAEGRQVTVTETVRFSTETVASRLLYQFNFELRQRLVGLQEEFDLDTDQFRRRIAYHDTVCRERLPAHLRNQSISEIAVGPDEVGELQEEASGPTAELADLWIAYKRQLSSELDPSQRYDSALKPASKVFELWCLSRILSVLRSMFGRESRMGSANKFPRQFWFGDSVALHYDRSRTNRSKYLKDLFRPSSGLRAGAPDFIIEVDEEIRWVADAKFQRPAEIDLGGAQRFLSYVIDYLPSPGVGASALLCIDEEATEVHSNIEGYPFQKLGVGPETEDTLDALRDTLVRATDAGGTHQSYSPK